METNEQAAVGIYSTHTEAEAVIRELERSGFTLKNLSILGKDYRTEEHAVGYYNTGERAMVWGTLGAFWGGLMGFMFGSALFFIPGIGPLLVMGPLVGWMVGALEGAAVVGGLSALGAALYSIGIPKDSIIKYESHVKAGKFLVLAHGSPEEVTRAKGILHSSNPVEVSA